MQVKREDLPGNKVKLTISLDMEEWNPMVAKAAEEISKNMNIEGFRPGKAPLDVVMAKAGEARVISVALEEAVEKYYPQAARDEGLRPIAFPSMAVEKGGLTEPLVFTAEVLVMPEVRLGDYTKIRVKVEKTEIDEAEVTKTLEGLQKKSAEHVDVEGREAKEGDWAEIDFTGTVDGVEFPGGASKNHPMVIGEKMFIPGFEEGVVGMKVGEEKNVEVTFPAEYHSAELAGKKAVFAIKLHKIKAINVPALDDSFAAKVSQFKTLDELKGDIRKFMEEDANRKAQEKAREEAILELTKTIQVDLPEELVEQELTSMLDDLKKQIANAHMTIEQYLGKANTDEAGLRAEWKEQAVQRVKAGLALDALVTAENIVVTHDDVHAEIDRLKELYPDQVEEIEEAYGGHKHGHLESQMRTRKVVDRLMELATGQ
jgi:trigger factor